MRSRYTLLVIAFVAISSRGFAQYASDAVRYSTGQTGSTSRIKAIGNAGTAVGGDLSNVSGNPAGLGYFTHSEASLTPEYDASKNNSAYLGQQGSASKNTVNFNNASFVFYSRMNTPSGQDKGKGWLSVNFGIAYDRTNNFDERIQYSGKNNTSSVTDYYASLANSFGVDNSDLQSWAYGHKLISAYGTPSQFTYGSNAYPGVVQTNSINRSGGQSALDLAVGANYSNKLYLGLGVGITTLRYKVTNVFNETGTATISQNNVPTDRAYNSDYSRFQDTKGQGLNARLGVIYKPIDFLRLGATITSPTFITVDDSYGEGLATSYTGANYANGPINYPLTYNMRTPFKAAGGLSIFMGNYGFITGDVEYIDYSTTRLSTNDDYNGSYDNGIIKSTYRSVVNTHAGAEIKLGVIALRGGYGIQGSPLKTGGTSIKTTTAGLGYRSGNYAVDLAYVHYTNGQNIIPYSIGDATPSASITGANNNIFMTLSYRY